MNEFLILGGIFLVAAMSPGPDFLIVLRNSLIYSRKTAFYTILGTGLGILFHVSYILLGIGLLITKSIVVFNLVKYVGAAYLIYLGIKSLRSKKTSSKIDIDAKKQKDISPRRAIQMGLLTNALNPKATLFFVAVFTQFIHPETSALVKVGYGLEMIVISLAWFSVVALFLTQAPIKKRFLKLKHNIERIFGAVLIGLGIKLAVGDR